MSMLGQGTFNDRVCVVTGGGSGIGAAIAGMLAALGGRVAVLGRQLAPLESTVAEIARAGGTGLALPVDVRDHVAVEQALTKVSQSLGPVDHLVNCAAGNFRLAPEKLSPNGWQAITRIVLDGTWNCTQVVGRALIDAGRPGSIVSLGSSKAHAGGADTVPSAAAKAGVYAMTRSLAEAWGRHGIRLNIVTPGVTLGTGAVARLFADPGALERDRNKVPLGRHTTLAEVSDAVSYLLSDHASSITGAELVLDGGRSLGIG